MQKALFLSVLALGLIGCGGGAKTLDGKWNVTPSTDSGLPQGSKATIDFKSGDAFAMNIEVKAPDSVGKDLTMKMDYTGTYKKTADQLDMTFTGFNVKVDDAKVQSMLDASLGANKKDMLSKMGQSMSGPIKWVDSNNITITTKEGKALALTRAN